MRTTKCPKCGRITLQGNALAIWCMYCGFQVEDPAPLPKDRDERIQMLNRGRARRRR